jgi:hypothetical protein
MERESIESCSSSACFWFILLFLFLDFALPMECLPSSAFYFSNEPIWLAHHKEKTKTRTLKAPLNRRFYGKMECLPLWPSYIGEKTLGKTYRIKVRWYREHPWGTHWEPDGNSLGTWREHVGNKGKMKNSSPHWDCLGCKLGVGFWEPKYTKKLIWISGNLGISLGFKIGWNWGVVWSK